MINIIKKQDCCGCYACYNICPQKCISMLADDEGFWYPVVDIEECTDCGLCEKVCPILNKKIAENCPVAYACINKEDNIREQSSSGGVFTVIAERVIVNNGVVFGAGFDGGFNVIHRWTDRMDGLGNFRGSKYVQSCIGDTYNQVRDFLNQKRQVLFSGTPCQIAGLRSYLGKDYETLICLDIVCHGVPSPKVWQCYKLHIEEIYQAKAQRITFRRKNCSWKLYSLSFSFDNDKEYSQKLTEDIFMQGFLKNLYLRPSCYNCNFKTLNRQSDITLADFWGIQNVLPEMDDDKGTSLVFVNSARGKSMFNQINDNILYKEVDINQAVAYNSAAIKSVEQNPKRDKFFEELDKISFDKLVKKYCSDSVLMRIMRKAKSVVRIALDKIGLLKILKNLLRRKRRK